MSRYVNHTSPTRRLAHFPQLSHELSPATGPYKRPQPATISLPRCDCNLGHIRELCATRSTPCRSTRASPHSVSPTRFAPALSRRPHRALTAPRTPGGLSEARLVRARRATRTEAPRGGLDRSPKRLKGVNCRRLGSPSRVSSTDPVPGPPKSGVAALKPLPRCQNKALGVDSTPLPDASARDLVTLRLWRRQRIWQ